MYIYIYIYMYLYSIDLRNDGFGAYAPWLPFPRREEVGFFWPTKSDLGSANPKGLAQKAVLPGLLG